MKKFNNIIAILEGINICILSCMAMTKYSLYSMLPSTIIAIIFFIVKIIKKEKITFNVMDLLILIFPFTYFIALIAKNYATLKGTIDGILYSFSLYSIYIVLRNIKDKNKILNIIANALIIANLIYILIGIDIRTTKITYDFWKKFLGVGFQLSDKNRFNSIIGYINASAIFMAVAYLMSFYKYIISNKKITKAIYLGIANLFFAFFILSYSKMAIMLAMILYLALAIMLLKKDSKYKLDIITSIINHIIFSSSIIVFYNKLLESGTWKIFLIVIIYVIVYAILMLITNYMKKRVSKENKNIENTSSKKRTLCISLIAGILLMAIVTTDLIVGKTLVIDNNNKKKINTYYDIGLGKNYNINFDIKITTKNEKTIETDKELFEINIIENNESNTTTNTKKTSIKINETEKNISLNTMNDTIRIKIEIKKLTDDDVKMTVEKCTINDKELKLEYNIIPTRLVSSVASIFNKNISIYERVIGMKDGLKIGIENFWTGTGNNSWRYVKLKDQTFKYGCTDVHCYPIVIFVENGFFGVLDVFIIVILLIYFIFKIYKKSSIKNINISFMVLAICILEIILHSLVDFDLSINEIKILFVTLFALFMNEIDEKTKIYNLKARKTVPLAIILLCILNISMMPLSQRYFKI